MYLLNVSAIVEAEKVVPFRPAHQAWVKQGIDKGWFAFAGPKTNNTGGLILANEIPLDELSAFIATDPYVKENVVKYEIIDFNIALVAEGLEQLKLNMVSS